ncbi:hypothetical protein OHU34_06055 [Streptomyces sp. NBC_00080]|uniref:hypothetical protein n=1 Tax=Streptomyces TaxID=1883 RepID=UPI001E6418F6|nr:MULTISPECIES: hypothetical protein [Streptomyces]
MPPRSAAAEAGLWTAIRGPPSSNSGARGGADYIRTHDVAALRDALTVFEALEPAKEGGW